MLLNTKPVIMADLDLWVSKSFLSNYADDTQTCVIADSPEELRKIIEEESKAVLDFFSSINLCNNSDKAAIIVNSKGSADKMTVNIGGKNVSSKDEETSLIVSKSDDSNSLFIASIVNIYINSDSSKVSIC